MQVTQGKSKSNGGYRNLRKLEKINPFKNIFFETHIKHIINSVKL